MYIIIETFDPEFPNIVTNEDGIPLIFETEAEANIEAEDCQDPIIVNIN